MKQLVVESRWINGRHCPVVHPDVKSALRHAIEGERAGTQGRSQIVITWSPEDCASGRVVIDHKMVNHADWALGGAHPPAWRNREPAAARAWQAVCQHVRSIKV